MFYGELTVIQSELSGVWWLFENDGNLLQSMSSFESMDMINDVGVPLV